MKKIAVYSGSFNPLHIGHLAILKYLTEEGGFDCVYLIVSPKNPLKDNISSSTGAERFRAAQEAVARHFADSGKVLVNDIELTMPEPHYTIKTLDALKAREPENDFTFVMGSDNLADIRRWQDYDRILREYGVLVFPREGFDTQSEKENLFKEDPDYDIGIINAGTINISSTDIRKAKATGQNTDRWLM